MAPPEPWPSGAGRAAPSAGSTGLLRTGGPGQPERNHRAAEAGRRAVWTRSPSLGPGEGAMGRPAIDWVSSDPREPRRLLAYAQPEGLRAGLPWEVDSGLSGGPRLIARGHLTVSDRSERLASAGLLPRTFVGYATRAGVPRYMVLGVATAMTFQDAAQFLDLYFRPFH